MSSEMSQQRSASAPQRPQTLALRGVLVYTPGMHTALPVPYLAFAPWLRRRHGRPIRKIPLDAGGTCPNRVPHANTGGCRYCNARGAGTGLHHQGLSLTQQWQHWLARYARRSPNALFLAYLQSFSNTYRSPRELAIILEEIRQFKDLAAIALGTRPDCLDDEKLDMLAAARHPLAAGPGSGPVLDVWLELGLQSASNATLLRINRGHDVETLQRAVHAAHARGLLLCLHVMHGLPGETAKDFFRTIDCVNALPVQAVKFHNTLVLDGSVLALDWQTGAYSPPARAETVAALAEGLARLRPDIVIQRLTADAWPGELLAPAWAADKSALRTDIIQNMVDCGWTQGFLYRPSPHHGGCGMATFHPGGSHTK